MKPAFFTTNQRHGDARSPGALARLLRSKGQSPTAARARQVHGSRVVVVPSLSRETLFEKVDGFLTRAPGQALAIFTADCVPIFLSAEKGRTVGLLHAGWRGVRSEILKKAVQQMRKRWAIPARQIDVWVGPSIGACCFEVQWDVAKHFPFSRRRKKDRWVVDLSAELKRQARVLRVHWRADLSDASCTHHHKTYFSYRRDATDKRQVSVIQSRHSL